MSFGRWLLVHSFSIFLLVVALLGYVYRNELQLQQVYEQILNLDPETDPMVALKGDQNSPPASASRTPSIAAVGGEKSAAPSANGSSVSAQSVAPVVLPPSQPTVSMPRFELNDRLHLARKAYWDKDYKNAIFYYQQLIREDSGNPDYIGELGNIFYSLNDFENASQQFYQAALILIARGQFDQARLLVSPVTAMNRDLGDQLRQRLREVN